jgi:probable addiction module antidote protein
MSKARSKISRREEKGDDSQELVLKQLNHYLSKGNYPEFLAGVLPMLQARGVLSVSRELKLQREALYRSFNGQRRPRFDTVCRVLSILGYSIELRSVPTTKRRQDPDD